LNRFALHRLCRRIIRLAGRPARLIDGPIRDARRRTQVVGIAHGRTLAQQRHLEREIGAAHAGACDRLHLLDAGADLDRT
jgi:hypothetical protein